MATIEENIQLALFKRVESLSLSPSYPIAWPNKGFSPPADGKYLDVTHFPNTVRRLFVKGSAPHQRLGILQITVVQPLNVGVQTAAAIAGAIADHFPADLNLYEGGIRVRIEAAPSILPGVRREVYWDTPVSIRYESLS